MHRVLATANGAEAALSTAMLAGVAYVCGIIVVMVTYRLIDARAIARIRAEELQNLERAGISPVDMLASATGHAISASVDPRWLADQIANIGEREATPPTERQLVQRYRTRQVASGLTVSALLLGLALLISVFSLDAVGVVLTILGAAAVAAVVVLLRLTAVYQERVRQRKLFASAMCTHQTPPGGRGRLRSVS